MVHGTIGLNRKQVRRKGVNDLVGIIEDEMVCYKTVGDWINENPLGLWDSLYDGIHKTSLQYDAYSILMDRIMLLYPDKITELHRRRHHHKLIRKSRMGVSQ